MDPPSTISVNELKATPNEVLRILPIGTLDGIWVTIADASMADVENKSQGGFIVAYANGKIMHGERADFSIEVASPQEGDQGDAWK